MIVTRPSFVVSQEGSAVCARGMITALRVDMGDRVTLKVPNSVRYGNGILGRELTRAEVFVYLSTAECPASGTPSGAD